ncbi:MAG: hypothetical protein KOO63_07920 [Bacteroidales bacterium]|nr:hypothetical protein [Candidatus Latescibacterota bacterium]
MTVYVATYTEIGPNGNNYLGVFMTFAAAWDYIHRKAIGQGTNDCTLTFNHTDGVITSASPHLNEGELHITDSWQIIEETPR